MSARKLDNVYIDGQPPENYFAADNPNRIRTTVYIMFDEESKKPYRLRSQAIVAFFYGSLPEAGQTLSWDCGEGGEKETTAEHMKKGLFSTLTVVEEIAWNAGRTKLGEDNDVEKIAASPTVYLRPKNIERFHNKFPISDLVSD